MWRNNKQGYGTISIALHWLMAVAIFGLFGLGIYMTDLGYYDQWYTLGPYIHEGVGVCAALLLLVRLVWLRFSPKPEYEPDMIDWQKTAATLTHYALYGLMLVIVLSGYMITTANGDGLNFFDLIELPALSTGVDRQEDYAGKVHWYLSLALMILVGLHTAAALKHHFVNRDQTLKRMISTRYQHK